MKEQPLISEQEQFELLRSFWVMLTELENLAHKSDDKVLKRWVDGWHKQWSRITGGSSSPIWGELRLHSAIQELKALPVEAPDIAVKVIASELLVALNADKAQGYDTNTGVFGQAVSQLLQRWAQTGWASLHEVVAVNASSAKLSPADFAQLMQAIADYRKTGKADVSSDVLLRAAVAGYFVCGNFALADLESLERDAAQVLGPVAPQAEQDQAALQEVQPQPS